MKIHQYIYFTICRDWLKMQQYVYKSGIILYKKAMIEALNLEIEHLNNVCLYGIEYKNMFLFSITKSKILAMKLKIEVIKSFFGIK